MPAVLRRLNPAVSLVALFIALLALVASAAGVGYAAGTIGAKDLKKNAVTAPKIKKNAVTAKKIKANSVTGDKILDGSVGVADLPAEEAQKAVGFYNGGEGDCVWQNAADIPSGLPGTNRLTVRKDRFGTIHMTGLIVGSDGPGGDGTCSSGSGQESDLIAAFLPAGYIPAKTTVVPGSLSGSGGAAAIIVGASGLNGLGVSYPAGALLANTDGAILDGVDYLPAGSPVQQPGAASQGSAKPSPMVAELLASLSK